ncbi:LYR motif-containing protein 2 [Dermatophagoides pteronyssinus]|uniref:LYR motif-containing protein 2 n=2 Tax=Dermatophagoides pteronyssinus TaxID=6956 RepID=A0A6P6Y7Z7_DERPT|nr:LYR motif-containing protein 2-like [Dermatophagoides pteronyssinus]KAH9421609.1 LYR motif-containing protein 2 [Dermatophagoides pteronyssinus]
MSRRRLQDNTLSLFHFIRRQRTLSLYRQFFRLIQKIDNKQQRMEIRNWIREEFYNMKHITDKELIDMNLTRGNNALKELENFLRQSHAFKD